MANQGSYDLRHDVDRLQRKVNVFEDSFADSFFIETSVPTIIYKDDIFNPKSITFYSYKNNKGKIETYKGTLKVSTSVDGNTYTLLKTSNDTNITINLSDNTIKFYKCELYDAENQLLDSQTIPSLTEGESSSISLFLGNESQLIPCTNDGNVQDTFSFTIPFYCYKGTKLYPCEYVPASPNPFTELGFSYNLDKQCSSTDNGQITITAIKDTLLGRENGGIISLSFNVDGETINKQFNWAKSIKGENGYSAPNGYVHFAYANDDKGETGFSTEDSTNREYMGTYYDYVRETSQDPSRYTWSLIKGEDGKTPSTDELLDSVNESGIDAKTLDGKNPTSFISSMLPTTVIYRDETDATRNFVTIYELGNLVIVEVYRFSGDSSDYGDDGDYYFRLFPNQEKYNIPERLRPHKAVYINDLNTGVGNGANGKLSISPSGVVRKSKECTGSYVNSYGTFIYAINPRSKTTLSGGGAQGEYGDYFSYHLKDEQNQPLPNRNVTFTVNGINYNRLTDDYGAANLRIRIVGTVQVKCKFNGDDYYEPSNELTSTEMVGKTYADIDFAGGIPTDEGYVLDGDILTIQAKNDHNNILPQLELLINNKSYTTNNEGEVKLTVKENGTFVCKFADSTKPYLENTTTFEKSVTITGKTNPVITQTRVPLSLSAGGTTGRIKGYNADTLNVARVQKHEGTAITCAHNSNSSASLRTTPAQIYFNVFKFPRPTRACTVTATVYCGEFGNITGGHMNFPKLQLKDVINNIAYEEKITSGNFGSGNKNTYLAFTITHTFTTEQVGAIESDNFAVLVIPQESNLTSTASYNASEFRIDYVEMKIEY